MHVTARDAAKFAQLYINDGVFDGKQVISSEWVHDSLQAYSTGEQPLSHLGPVSRAPAG
jgi:CubicO group peptidase (beta-lactamase class C family)